MPSSAGTSSVKVTPMNSPRITTSSAIGCMSEVCFGRVAVFYNGGEPRVNDVSSVAASRVGSTVNERREVFHRLPALLVLDSTDLRPVLRPQTSLRIR